MVVIKRSRAQIKSAHTHSMQVTGKSAIRLMQLWLFTAVLLLAIINPTGWFSKLVISQAGASAQTSGLWPSFRHGAVYTRNFVRGPNGERIFAEYGADGAVIQEYGEAIGNLQGAAVLSGDAYRFYVDAYNQLIEEKGRTDAKGAYIVSREVYEATSFTTLNGEPVRRLPLLSSTKSVVVRHINTILTPSSNPILMQAAIDLQNMQVLSESVNAVLLSEKGQVLKTSENNIAYRTAYLKPKGGDPKVCSPGYGPEQDNRGYRRPGGDDVCGPISGAMVSGFALPGRERAVSTDEYGRYTFTYMNLPCPGFDFEFVNYIMPKLYYSTFNPRAKKGVGMYYRSTPAYDWCFGSHEILKSSGNLIGLMTYFAVENILSGIAPTAQTT